MPDPIPDPAASSPAAFPRVLLPGNARTTLLQHAHDNLNLFVLPNKAALRDTPDPCAPPPSPPTEPPTEPLMSPLLSLLLLLLPLPFFLPPTLPPLLFLLALTLLIRLPPALRPGPPATPDVYGTLLFDGYAHHEADERVFLTLTHGIATAEADGKHMLEYYHLQKPPGFPANDLPAYKILNLSPANYDNPCFHHPPLFPILAHVYLKITALPFPSFPVLLSLLPPLLMTFLPVHPLAPFFHLLSPTVTFCSQKFWSDNLLPPLILLSLTASFYSTRHPATIRSHLLQLLAGLALGLALLVKVTSLALLLPLTASVLHIWQSTKSHRIAARHGALCVSPGVIMFGLFVKHFVKQTVAKQTFATGGGSGGDDDWSSVVAVISSMWPSADLKESSAFMSQSGDHTADFYLTQIILSLHPLALLALPALLPPYDLHTLLHILTLIAYVIPFTIIGAMGGLYQSRHILPALPSLAIATAAGCVRVTSWYPTHRGAVGSYVAGLAVWQTVNVVLAVYFIAPYAGDCVDGLVALAGRVGGGEWREVTDVESGRILLRRLGVKL